MASKDPLELLKYTLDDHEIALRKSTNLFNRGLLDEQTHETHKKNLGPLIEKYQYAIYILEKHGAR